MNQSIRRQEDLFSRALVLPAGDREAFLRAECGTDVELRRRVVALLTAAERAGAFLDDSAGGPRPEERGCDSAWTGSWVGNYRIKACLGEGGCGMVFEAEQLRPIRRAVALKLLRPGRDSREVVARFEAERQALARMDHPNIARVFDAGTSDSGLPFFVMELIRGQPITRFCDERRLGVPARLELFVQVCRAMHHAHEKGVVHRDIKPSNILVAEFDGTPVPKVIDFGVAKAIEAPLTETPLQTAVTQLIGTPAYMSPEQVQLLSHTVDRRTDVHGLGILLHELLIGATPLDARELAEAGIDGMRRRICEDAVVPPSARYSAMTSASREEHAARRATDPDDLLRALTGALDAIVMRCLRKQREHRYATAEALAADVLRHGRGEVLKGAGCMAAADPHPSADRTPGRHETPPTRRSVAVLPFIQLGAVSPGACLAEGIHEDVITHLAKIHGLRVIARSSVAGLATQQRNPRTIANELDVGYVMEGSVRQAGVRVRVAVQLTEASSLRVVWAESFDREVTEVFALQSALAREIAGALSIDLSARERLLIDRAPTENQAAYAAFLRGRALVARTYNREDLTGAVAAFEEAVALDPRFALAWAHLSMAHGAMYWFTFLDPTPARLARCKAAVDEALRLQPDLPEAHLTLGLYYYRGFRDWRSAWSELEEAHASMPGDADVLCARGLTLRRMGRWGESTEAFAAAVSRDPRNGQAWLGLADNHGFHRRFEEALATIGRVLAVAPDHRLAARHACWYQFALSGDRAGLLESLGRLAHADAGAVRDRFELALLQSDWDGAMRVLEQTPLRSFRDQKREVAKSELRAMAHLLSGDEAGARAHAEQAATFYAQSSLQREPEQVFTTMSLARALALQGRVQDALVVGRRAMEQLPIARDAMWGQEIIGEYAALCLLVGEVDEALVHLCDLLRHPWDVSAHELRFDPIWRRLAGDSRFESIIALADPVRA